MTKDYDHLPFRRFVYIACPLFLLGFFFGFLVLFSFSESLQSSFVLKAQERPTEATPVDRGTVIGLANVLAAENRRAESLSRQVTGMQQTIAFLEAMVQQLMNAQGSAPMPVQPDDDGVLEFGIEPHGPQPLEPKLKSAGYRVPTNLELAKAVKGLEKRVDKLEKLAKQYLGDRYDAKSR